MAQNSADVKHPMRPRRDDRRLQRGRSFWLNRFTSPARMLPDFLVLGEMKSGTTSLFKCLQYHSKIAPPIRKETHYFSIGHRRYGKTWYRSHFPLHHRRWHGALTGEATPCYLFAPGADARIKQTVPQARFIVLLRDPVERAVSHYFHEVRMGRETLPIREALAVEEERLASADIDDPDGYEMHLHASYKRRGQYADSLERYFQQFPRDQFLIIGSGELYRDPAATTRRVWQFLELDEEPGPDSHPVRNKGTNRTDVQDDVYAYLTDYFEPHNRRLFDLLGYSLAL